MLKRNNLLISQLLVVLLMVSPGAGLAGAREYGPEDRPLRLLLRDSARDMMERPYREEFPLVGQLGDRGWFSVDIAPFCNRNFTTWVGDGNTLSYLETGRRVFYGVPFLILDPAGNNDRTLVTLPSERISGPGITSPVAIPVNRTSPVFYFLHTGYQTLPGGKRYYQLTYRDGTSERLEITANENIADWFPQQRIYRPGVRYVLVPTSEHFSPVFRNLYVLEWVNPHPEKEVADIVLFSDGRGDLAVMLLAITGHGGTE